MNLELDLEFAKAFAEDRFFFGVANAPYLCEGGYNTPDGIKNSYGILEAQGRIERSGEAVRFWTNYEEQIRLAASLGLNAFRMGIDWSRVQPSTSLTPHEPPEWDLDALEHYADIIATVQAHGLEPIVTLHHFTHPAWLGWDMWNGDAGPELLLDYQQRVVDEVNQRLVRRGSRPMRHFLVYNEPNLVPILYFGMNLFPEEGQGYYRMPAAYDRMFSVYVRSYDNLHDLFERRGWGIPEVGFTIASMCTYETDRIFFDVVRARMFGIERPDIDRRLAEFRSAWNRRIGALAKSKLTDAQFERYTNFAGLVEAMMKPSQMERTLDALYRSPRMKKLDYLSVNVYEPFGVPRSNPDFSGYPEWWKYAADGEIYRTFIHAYNEGNRDLPIYMGENSLAYEQPVGGEAKPRPDGWTRERYLKTYFMEMIRCMKEGVPIRGYLYWSLVDDFEWHEGYAPRLGLYNYDYLTHTIAGTDGLGEPAGPIYGHLVAALRSGDKEVIARTFTERYALPAKR